MAIWPGGWWLGVESTPKWAQANRTGPALILTHQETWAGQLAKQMAEAQPAGQRSPCSRPLTWNHLAWRRAASDWRHFSGLKMSPGSGGGSSVPPRRKGCVVRRALPLPSLPGPCGPRPSVLWASLHLSKITRFFPARLSCRTQRGPEKPLL